VTDMDPLAVRIADTLADAIRAGELGDDNAGMVGTWVLVSTHYDSDGDQRVALVTNDGSHIHETLGLLDLGKTVWQEQARRWVLGVEAEDE
jgi:hypothetical protein